LKPRISIVAAADDTIESLFNRYSEVITQGTQVNLSEIPYTDPRLKLHVNLQNDASRFVHFRQAQKEKELAQAKTDLDKQKVERRYKNYQETEQQTIFANSAAAERWMGFEENADIYPNLEYRTAGDSDVRPEHAKLDGIILPMNDPFWSGHTPPLGFGCRCELIQTDDPVNKSAKKYEGFEETPVPKGFNFNPGVEQKLFDNDAGYYTSATKTESARLNKTAETFFENITKNYGKKYIGKTLATGAGKMKVTETGLKKAVNQPHRDFNLKNAVLENLPGLVKDLQFKPVPGQSELIYAKFKLNGKNSYVIAQKADKALQFATITDTLNFKL
jgi:SPP1 gp7 family putative phage head morphogenesis protein